MKKVRTGRWAGLESEMLKDKAAPTKVHAM